MQDIHQVDTFEYEYDNNYKTHKWRVLLIDTAEAISKMPSKLRFGIGGEDASNLAHYYKNKLVIVEELDVAGKRTSFFEDKDIFSVCKNHTFKPAPIPLKPVNRFQLISDSLEKKSMTKTVAQEEIFSLVSQDIPAENNMFNEISNLKDQLFGKVKLQAQTNQAKKDMASGYRETLGQLKEEIEDLLVKITSLQDQVKVTKAK